MRLTRSQDFWAGILFIFAGALTMWLARDYPLGSARRMGAGYYPMLIATGLCIVGAVLTARGWTNEGRCIEKGALRPFLSMIGVVAFALLLQPAGLVIAVVALMAIAAFAGRGSLLLETLGSTIFLVVFAAIVFIWGLELPITLLPQW